MLQTSAQEGALNPQVISDERVAVLDQELLIFKSFRLDLRFCENRRDEGRDGARNVIRPDTVHLQPNPGQRKR